MIASKKNRVGRNSLVIAIVGLAVVQTLIFLGYLRSDYWNILLSGFEAATIGGVADWFAVSALFHEIPLPLVKRHTNIIVRNRKKLTEGVVDLVTNKWLSPEVIKEKLADIPLIENLVKTLQEPNNQLKTIDFLKVVARRLTVDMDSPEVAQMAQHLLKDQIKGVEIAAPLGQWLSTAIHSGDHHQIWEMVLDSTEKSIHAPATRSTLLKLVDNQMAEYKDEGFTKRLLIGFARGVGALDNPSITDKIINSIQDLIAEARNNPYHPVRLNFDKHILEFAEKLICGEPESTRIITSLQDKLVDNTRALPLIQSILATLKATLSTQLQNNDTPLMCLIRQNMEKLLHELQTDRGTQSKIDHWIKNTIEQMLGKYHHEVGEMVRFSLSKLDDTALVSQIEEKVGNDLQFIRLNGAVVGGCVGLVIALIRLMATS